MIHQVSKELESIRSVSATQEQGDGASFPMACRTMLYSLPGNTRCVDCGAARPQWASVSYGILLCLQCSGRHRAMGVATSRVRSIEMDAWSHQQVIAMLEGGNDQLTGFFGRHSMEQMDRRYDTKAALFYRSNLQKHVEAVATTGLYKGREASRRRYQSRNSDNKMKPAASLSKSLATAALKTTNKCPISV